MKKVMKMIEQFVNEVLQKANLFDEEEKVVYKFFANDRIIVSKLSLKENQNVCSVSILKCPHKNFSLHIRNHPTYPVILFDTKERIYLTPSNSQSIKILLKKAHRIIRRWVK